MASNRAAAQAEEEGAPCAGAVPASAAPHESEVAGATANLACFKWLQYRGNSQAKCGVPAAEANLAVASFKFGSGRLEQVQFAARAPAAILVCLLLFRSLRIFRLYSGDWPSERRVGSWTSSEIVCTYRNWAPAYRSVRMRRGISC